MSNVTNVTILDTWLNIVDLETLQIISHKIKMKKYGKIILKGVLSLSRLKVAKMCGMLIGVAQRI